MTSPETAVERHDRMWREEREQAERLRSDRADADHWRPNAPTFQPSFGGDDPVVAALAPWVTADSRVTDVGAGGGRIAVPLARQVREVVAVEPSASMRDVLAQAAREHGLTNITVVPSTWEAADVSPADLVFASHVTYSVARIEPFLRKMDRVATSRVALVTFGDPAQHIFAPFWRAIYGEERLRLPVRAELIAVLRELGIEPREEPLPPREPASLGTPEEAFAQVRARLFIGEGSAEEARLRDAMADLAKVCNGEVWVRGAPPNEISLLTWTPAQ